MSPKGHCLLLIVCEDMVSVGVEVRDEEVDVANGDVVHIVVSIKRN